MTHFSQTKSIQIQGLATQACLLQVKELQRRRCMLFVWLFALECVIYSQMASLCTFYRNLPKREDKARLQSHAGAIVSYCAGPVGKNTFNTDILGQDI
jgi:hypothetical protein